MQIYMKCHVLVRNVNTRHVLSIFLHAQRFGNAVTMRIFLLCKDFFCNMYGRQNCYWFFLRFSFWTSFLDTIKVLYAEMLIAVVECLLWPKFLAYLCNSFLLYHSSKFDDSTVLLPILDWYSNYPYKCYDICLGIYIFPTTPELFLLFCHTQD